MKHILFIIIILIGISGYSQESKTFKIIKYDSAYLNNIGWIKPRSSGDIGYGYVKYNGLNKASAQFYGGSTDPTSLVRINYDGLIYATSINGKSGGTGYGVYGNATSGYGISGYATTGNAIYGNCFTGVAGKIGTTNSGSTANLFEWFNSSGSVSYIDRHGCFVGDSIKIKNLKLNPTLDTTVTAEEGTFVWKASDHAPYVCVSTTAAKKWYKCKLE